MANPFGSHEIGITTFESIVQGDSNVLAITAAKQVAKGAWRAGLMVIHGPTATGKSHLLNAIHQSAATQLGADSVLFIRHEAWWRRYISCLRSGQTLDFYNEQKNFSLLLIDDVDLEHSPIQQEGFFESLAQLQPRRAIVLACIKPPERLPEWSRDHNLMILGIGMPEFSQRKALVDRFETQLGLSLNPEAKFFIARHIQPSALDILSAMTRVRHQRGCTSVEDIQLLLRDMLRASDEV